MQSVFNGLRSCPHYLHAGLQYSRDRIFVFDLAYTSATCMLHAVVFRVFKYELFGPDHLTTYRQRKWEREVTDLRQSFEKRIEVTNFCHETAACVDAIVVKAVGEKLREVPNQVENWLFYWVGWMPRYAYRQFTKWGGRDRVLHSAPVSNTVQPVYYGLTTQVAHTFGGPIYHSLVNIERLLLKACDKWMKPSEGKGICFKEIIFKRVAKSLSQYKELEKIWKSDLLEGEKRIAVLHWLKKEGDLPKGLPDPDGLFPENLDQKEKESLSRYFKGQIEKFLEHHAPQELKSWFSLSGLLYKLEAKDLFVQLSSDLIIHLLISQVADPYRFSQTILLSKQEVMDLELDGYGMDKGDYIFCVGQEILTAVTEKKRIGEILEKEMPKRSPGGVEGNRQKAATKQQLQDYFTSIFLEMFNSGDVPKHSYEATKSIFGGGSIGWHYLFNAVNFGVQHLKTFSIFAFEKAQVGLASYFAGRMVELIYHPLWKIILLQLLEAISDGVDHPEREIEVEKEDFDAVAGFLTQHFLGVLEAGQLPAVHWIQSAAKAAGMVLDKWNLTITDKSAGTVIGDLIFSFHSDDLFKQFKNQFHQPSKKPMWDEKLEGLVPSMRESLLYCRFTDLLRKKGYAFEHDDKFWEVFLRLCLTHLVSKEIKTQGIKFPTQEKIVKIRTEKVIELLLLDENQLIECLLKLQGEKTISFEMEDFPPDLPTVKMFDQEALKKALESS